MFGAISVTPDVENHGVPARCGKTHADGHPVTEGSASAVVSSPRPDRQGGLTHAAGIQLIRTALLVVQFRG